MKFARASSSSRRPVAFALALTPALALAFAIALAPAFAPVLAERAAAAAPESKPMHLGVATCASSLCHGSVQPQSTTPVQQNEYVIWSNFDPHGRAHRALTESRGRSIGKRLGIAHPETAPQCVGCHADNVPAGRRGERFQLSDGVGCESCHGGAERWLASHTQSTTGSAVAADAHASNVALGMTALESPLVRSQVCLSCHLGEGNRLATHEMMAAGHPRLNFELDTYTELWRTAGGREHYRPDAARPNPHAVPMTVWLQGLAAQTDRSVDMLMSNRAGARGAMPDFALYNCYSCHRSMRVAGWDAKREESEPPPGTLRLQDGAARVLLTVCDALDINGAATLRAKLAELQKVSAAGTPAMEGAARAVHDSVLVLQSALRGHQWTKADHARALSSLVEAAQSGRFTDYSAAEQTAMGMVLLLAELDLNRRERPAIDALFGALERDDNFDAARFARILSQFKAR